MKSVNTILLFGIAAGFTAATFVKSFRHGPSIGSPGSQPSCKTHRLGGPSFTDLNLASSKDFENIGLERKAISRIIDNRPYRNKLELLSRLVIPVSVYGEIRHAIGVAPQDATARVA